MTRRFALITGASRGLGRCLATRFWYAGYSLGLVARTVESLAGVLSALPARVGQSLEPLAFDLGRPAEVASLIDHVRATLPRLDVLVNNAAIQGPIGPLEENDFALWRHALEVNLFAPVALCRGLACMLKDSPASSIINLSGGGATGPRAFFSAYATAKAGLVRVSETLADELKPHGVRINCIAPGAMKTEMLAEVLHSQASAGSREASLASEVFEKGGASMDRVADLALFLASDASRGITGKLISAVWDDWANWPDHISELSGSDVFTLRRIAGRDRGFAWGDK